MKEVLWGALALSSWAAGVFFLRFWRLSRDRLFLFLFLAFWVLCLNWTGLALINEPPETRHYVYALRLVAFLLIIVGIIDKNRPLCGAFSLNPGTGIEPPALKRGSRMPIIEPQAERAARILLSRLSAPKSAVAEGETWTPAWSSLVLETTIDEILSPPESRVADLMRGLWCQLSESGADLDPTMSNFLRDIVVLTFTRYRQRYEAEDFAWMEASVREGCTEAQGYLALHALPPGRVSAARDAILRALRGTAFLDEAHRAIETAKD